jgi:hypothetical protein
MHVLKQNVATDVRPSAPDSLTDQPLPFAAINNDSPKFDTQTRFLEQKCLVNCLFVGFETKVIRALAPTQVCLRQHRQPFWSLVAFVSRTFYEWKPSNKQMANLF